MARSYAEIRILVNQMLQDTGRETYDTPELGYWIEDALKEFSPYDPHIVDVIFKIESRTGTDTGSTTTALTDTTKAQFLPTDATLEKVVHNTTDNTWAVIMTDSNTEIQTLTASIMASGENYEIYNKRCLNNKQIYIGDMPYYLWIDSVEYPLGEKRNFKVYNEVLEIDVDSVADSDSTLDPPQDIDVLVRFAMPHRLCQLANLVGELTANESKGDIKIAVDGLTQGTGIVVEIGDEFHLENHRTLYTVTAATTLDGGGGNINLFPALEADATDNDDITFTKSTLKPQHEEIFCHLVVARALISKANAQLIQAKANLTTGLALINEINKGGAGQAVPTSYMNYARAEEELAREQRSMGERKLAEVIGKMERLSPPRTKRLYPTD